MDEDAATAKLLDLLMATGLAARAFMLEIALQFARTRSNPEKWAREFISSLHERMDANERAAETGEQHVHELARVQLDSLGKDLIRALRSLPRSKS